MSPHSATIRALEIATLLTLLAVLPLVTAFPAAASDTPAPSSVTVAGSLQSELGCSDDWQPGCAATHLAFDADDQVWQGSFDVPAGDWEYKAPLDDSWDENYGRWAQSNGPNIPLSLAAPATVKFYYSHETHWITDDHNALIAVAPGSFQSELGCPGDWQPDCLRSWLQDPDGDGVYTFSTQALPAGAYEVKVAIDESWAENYGAGGVRDGANISFSVPAACAPVFFSYDASSHLLTVTAAGAPHGSLARAQGYWVTEDTIAWRPGAIQPSWTFALHTSADGSLSLPSDGVHGGTAVPLDWDPAGLPAAVLEKFPHLAGFAAVRIPAGRLAEVPEALKGQLAVEAKAGDGTLVDATSLQVQGVLDDLYTYGGDLGVTFEAGAPTLRLWAPTARAVALHLFDSSAAAAPSAVVEMTADPATGVWSAAGDPSWTGKDYLYEVRVFVRSTGAVETNLVTDPYSVSLSRNSRRSQIVDLAGDPTLQPEGWQELRKPPLDAPEDIALYELHVRDFSAADPSVPDALEGTFAAFTLPDSHGMRHLRALARAGLTHVHLLPSFDVATIDEDKATWQEPAGDLASYPPDSAEQQAAVMAVAGADAYNWGYDPWHYTVPEGSYSTDPDSPARIREFRAMVQALNESGLRVVMDVVYNHTNSAGQNDKSVLDKIVPGYYHRLNADGNVETSSCCPNTASEFNMMEKLLIDSALIWVREYKVDGFRFDLMGHHMKRNLLALRQELDALTEEADGVDGAEVYVYGEGWNFGEVANNARGVQATQRNMAGTGIGSFNDRLRDGARGGGPFSGLQEQGFLTGLWYDPNGSGQGSPADQLARLLLEMDWIRAGLAGGLADYVFTDRNGNTVRADQIDYNGQPAGYTADPQEVINYVEAHDNETLFDAIALKAPVATPIGERVRIQNLGMSLLAFGQGVPFFHAGVELLRSKSLDRNSYNSGDWFNTLDFTYQDDNWGVGLPPAPDNLANWPLMAPLLADPVLDPAPEDIAAAVAHFQEALAIRKSTRLFRLRTADQVKQRLTFWNTGPGQVPGLIALAVADPAGEIDQRREQAAVLVNAGTGGVELPLPAPCPADERLRLHPLQAASADPIVRTAQFTAATCTFSVPGRTAAVFWATRPAAQQLALLVAEIDGLVADGTLNRGQGRALEAKLEAAQKKLRQGHAGPAAHQVRAFIHQVEAFAAAGVLSPEKAEDLVGDAAAILEELEG